MPSSYRLFTLTLRCIITIYGTHRAPGREKAVKLLKKVLGNLSRDPSNVKFGDLNHAKISKKLSGCPPALSLLSTAGFAPSADGQRLAWKNTLSNRKRVADLVDALHSKEKQASSDNSNAKDEAVKELMEELMQDGHSREEAEEAIRIIGGIDAPQATSKTKDREANDAIQMSEDVGRVCFRINVCFVFGNYI